MGCAAFACAYDTTRHTAYTHMAFTARTRALQPGLRACPRHLPPFTARYRCLPAYRHATCSAFNLTCLPANTTPSNQRHHATCTYAARHRFPGGLRDWLTVDARRSVHRCNLLPPNYLLVRGPPLAYHIPLCCTLRHNSGNACLACNCARLTASTRARLGRGGKLRACITLSQTD